MKSIYTQPVRYLLDLDNDFLVVNDLLDKKVKISYKEKIRCFCGEIVDKVYRQNFCYDCFWSRPEAGEFILKPELSKAHLDKEDRDLEWEKNYQLQEHVVYLANSGGLKVGVTRRKQVPTRWIDQGAAAAIELANTPNRYLAGCIEVALKERMSDKTAWQKMLGKGDENIDLPAEKKKAAEWLDDEYRQYICTDDKVWEMEYPVLDYPAKPKLFRLDKEASFEGRLKGIRGQYLIFEGGKAVNIRGHEGYIVDITL